MTRIGVKRVSTSASQSQAAVRNAARAHMSRFRTHEPRRIGVVRRDRRRTR